MYWLYRYDKNFMETVVFIPLWAGLKIWADEGRRHLLGSRVRFKVAISSALRYDNFRSQQRYTQEQIHEPT
jgi:hypothetical protein